MKPQPVSSIYLPLPKDAVLSRLGANRHRTEIPADYAQKLNQQMKDAFALCKPCGVWIELPITAASSGQIETGAGILRSEKLAEFLQGCSSIFFMAATVGKEIVEETQRCFDEHDGAKALVYDAVASETVDDALGYIHKTLLPASYVRSGGAVLPQRYSAGYGDLGLDNQRQIADALQLTSTLGVQLTERFQMIPEKSVTAITGLRRNG